MTPDSSIIDVATQVVLTDEPFSEDIGSEPFLSTTRDVAPLSPIQEEPPAHTYPESGLVSFALDEATTQSESPGLIPGPIPDFGSHSTEDLPSAESSQMQEYEPEEPSSTSPPKESLIDTNGSSADLEAEAPAFHDASAVSHTDLREGALSMDDGATKHDDLPVSIPASSSPLPELPASNTEFPPPPQPDLFVPAVQERQPEASSHVVEVEVVSDSPSSEPALLPADINPAEAEPLPPVVPVALPTTAISVSDVNLKEDSESIKSKSDNPKVTAVGKKALKSFKGVFRSSKSKAAGSGLTSPSTDTLASVESQGKASINSVVETSPINGAAIPNKAVNDFSSSQDSLVSNKTALSVAKGGMKRLFGSKDKANVSSPSLESIPSVETQGSTSDTTLTPTPLGPGLKKKQRQQTIDNASPMLKGMFKGRNPLRKPTA